MNLQKHVHNQMVAALVGRCLGICPRTGDSFDVRTAVVLLDRDGDPAAVLSQAGWREIVSEGKVDALERAGLAPDPATVQRIPSSPASKHPTIVDPPLFEVVGEATVTIDPEV